MTVPKSLRIVLAAIVASVAIASIAVACSKDSTDVPVEEPAIAATVHISDGAFEPRDVEIEPGGSVLWINDDVTVHRLTFLDVDPRLDSGNIGKGRTWIHTFTAEGEYLYYDQFRNTMKGSVVVRPAP